MRTRRCLHRLDRLAGWLHPQVRRAVSGRPGVARRRTCPDARRASSPQALLLNDEARAYEHRGADGQHQALLLIGQHPASVGAADVTGASSSAHAVASGCDHGVLRPWHGARTVSPGIQNSLPKCHNAVQGAVSNGVCQRERRTTKKTAERCEGTRSYWMLPRRLPLPAPQKIGYLDPARHRSRRRTDCRCG